MDIARPCGGRLLRLPTSARLQRVKCRGRLSVTRRFRSSDPWKGVLTWWSKRLSGFRSTGHRCFLIRESSAWTFTGRRLRRRYWSHNAVTNWPTVKKVADVSQVSCALLKNRERTGSAVTASKGSPFVLNDETRFAASNRMRSVTSTTSSPAGSLYFDMAQNAANLWHRALLLVKPPRRESTNDADFCAGGAGHSHVRTTQW